MSDPCTSMSDILAEDSIPEAGAPLESILWQFRRGAEVYRAHLDERNVETYARRRFGLFVFRFLQPDREPELPTVRRCRVADLVGER